VSIVANITLFALKYWAGIVTGSIAIIADAWHTLTDSVSSLAVVISARISSKPADSQHPFGHGRIELIASLFIAALLFIVAFSFISEAWERYRAAEIVKYGTAAVIVTCISIIVKELLAQYAFRLGRKTGSEVLKADGWHHRSDAASSVVILIGIFLAKHLWWIDSLMAAIVSILIGYAGFKIIARTISSILGEPLDPSLIKEIRNIGDEIGGYAKDFHHFHYHNYISHSELTFHLRLPGGMPINKGHEIADKIESRIREKYGIETTIHIEPVK
jgi:cation diffusion facilitator family transporter